MLATMLKYFKIPEVTFTIIGILSGLPLPYISPVPNPVIWFDQYPRWLILRVAYIDLLLIIYYVLCKTVFKKYFKVKNYKYRIIYIKGHSRGDTLTLYSGSLT